MKMKASKRRLSIGSAIAVALIALLPASTATANNPVPPNSGCQGYFVVPAKPAPYDWDHGQDLDLYNCTGTVHFVNVWCHPYPSFEDDTVCWTYRIPPLTIQHVTVPSDRQVHRVAWY